MAITRGTTPTHTFNLPFDTSYLKTIRISYAQKRIVVIEKTEKDCVLDGNTVSVTLSQKDTLKFDDRRPVEIQIRVVANNGRSAATGIGELEVGRVLNSEVLL